MIELNYVANMRLPTEKAHGLQIMQNCEALAQAGARVRLWIPARVNLPELRGVQDVWQHYSVERCFALRALPCLDLVYFTLRYRLKWLYTAAFVLQTLTFTLAVLVAALFARADVFYSRDLPVLLPLAFLKPRRALAYEAHTLNPGRFGRWLQRQVVRRAGSVIATTAHLRDQLIALGADPARVLVAHDGIRAARFEHLPTQAEARARVGWRVPDGALVVGYVGRLHTMGMDKGVGLLVDAISALNTPDGAPLCLALVGGPDEMAEQIRARWLAAGNRAERFLYAGQVAPDAVPAHLSALDVCAMPFPWTEHFAYYASAIKLFEYMASERTIIASDLPSTAEVVRHEHSALLVPIEQRDGAQMRVDDLAAALARLRDDPALRARLAANARAEVFAHYTWDARARAILAHVATAT